MTAFMPYTLMALLSLWLVPMSAFAGVLNPDQTLEQAKAALAPVMANLKELDPADMEHVIYNQWFELAHELITKSHEQGADLSFAVRKATRKLKNQADELIRALNPNYGVAQIVNPSFRWAQNDTSVFFNVKFSTRWNAPGALEVNDANVDFQKGSLNFTGFGEHSNLKYKYELALNIFDYIVPEECTWSTASVGRLSIILRKKWARKWPRLLADRKQKISNMFSWMDFQEKQTFGDVPEAEQSSLSCLIHDKLYCLGKDKCVGKDKCAEDCRNSFATEDSCSGKPAKAADALSFTDTALVKGTVVGTIKIKAKEHTFDVDRYSLFWSDNNGTRNDFIASVPYSKEATHEIREKEITENRYVMVVPVNALGEHDGTQATIEIKDGYLPLKSLSGIIFHDTNKKAGQIGGTGSLMLPLGIDFNEVILHWGKSKSQKIKANSEMQTIKLEADDKLLKNFTLDSEKIPASAKYLLAFPKNEYGEVVDPTSLKIHDIAAPCSNEENPGSGNDCMKKITIIDDSNIEKGKGTFQVMLNEPPADTSKITHYTFYFGRKSCDPTGVKDDVLLREITVDEALSSMNTIQFTDVDIPETTTNVLVYTKNQHGESDGCASVDIIDHDEFTGSGSMNHFGRVFAHLVMGGDKATKKLMKKHGFTGDFGNFSEIVKFMEDAWGDDERGKEFRESIEKLSEKKQKKKENKKAKKEKKTNDEL
eukprot:GEMP01006965.1.p1 GENE.GEMP01006965.1~~GEMP01006965.1.p1  ORF type:complete len:709 (+),score=135.23 GEMP01006965.1:264-2390(+)